MENSKAAALSINFQDGFAARLRHIVKIEEQLKQEAQELLALAERADTSATGEWTLVCLAWNVNRMAALRLKTG